MSTKEIVKLSTLRLTTSEGPVEYKNIRLYLLEKSDEMIAGLPFTDGVGFKISAHLALAKSNSKLNKLNESSFIAASLSQKS